MKKWLAHSVPLAIAVVVSGLAVWPLFAGGLLQIDSGGVHLVVDRGAATGAFAVLSFLITSVLHLYMFATWEGSLSSRAKYLGQHAVTVWICSFFIGLLAFQLLPLRQAL